MTKEIRIVNCTTYSYIQERRRFGRWKTVWNGDGEGSRIKCFKPENGQDFTESILTWYIEDYLGTNRKHINVIYRFDNQTRV